MQLNEKKLSVIIPVYNTEKNISSCLDSLLGQAYKNIEIIVVDDGSTDQSLEIVKEYCSKDQRIRMVSKPNGGVSTARNAGMDVATGEWITFVDSDDTVENNIYVDLMNEINEPEIDIAHCSYYKIDIDGKKHEIGGSQLKIKQTSEEALSCLIRGVLFTGGTWNKIYRRSLLSNIRFSTDLKINEDVLFNYEAMKRAKQLLFFDKCMYNYYERAVSSGTRVVNSKKVIDSTKVAEIIFQNEIGTGLEIDARNKLFMAYCGELRYYIFNRNKESEKNIKARIRPLLEKGLSVPTKYLWNYRAMEAFPIGYQLLYKVYNAIRKPNWDV